MDWFQHPTQNLDDPDMNLIMDEFGDAGYVMFFGLLEMYGAEYSNTDDDGYFTVPFSLVRRKLRKNRKMVELFLNYCQKSLSKPRFMHSSNGKTLSYKVPKFIEMASNWTKRQKDRPTEVPIEAPTAKEKEVEYNKNKVSKDTLSTPPKCPHTDIINTYHNVLPELAPIKVWDETAKKWLRARWREDPERQTLSWWGNYFVFVRESPFLMGKKKNWQADLRWLIRQQNFAKVLNGVYHRDIEHDIKPETYAQAQDFERRKRAAWLLRERERENEINGEVSGHGDRGTPPQLPMGENDGR